ncbi:MAG: GAF domain-containing protein [Candidatus Thermoplasmatota archaeon]
MAPPVSFPEVSGENPQEELGETQILAALLGIAEMVGQLTDTDEFLDAIVRIAPSLVRVDRCAVFSYDEAAREFAVVSSFGPGGKAAAFAGLRIPESDMPRLAQRLVSLRLPALVKDASKDLALPPAVVKRLGVRSALLVPLACRGRFLGCLWLDDSSSSHYFTSKEINLIQGIGMEVAIALDNAGQTKALVLEDRRFEALARALSDGIITLDQDLRILRMDHATEDLLGWQSSEVKGRRVNEVFDISEAEASVAWRKEAGGPSPAAKDLSLRTHDGTRLSCQVLTIPVRGDEGGVAQILYVLRNLAGAKGVHAKAMDALRELVLAQSDVPRE